MHVVVLGNSWLYFKIQVFDEKVQHLRNAAKTSDIDRTVFVVIKTVLCLIIQQVFGSIDVLVEC